MATKSVSNVIPFPVRPKPAKRAMFTERAEAFEDAENRMREARMAAAKQRLRDVLASQRMTPEQSERFVAFIERKMKESGYV